MKIRDFIGDFAPVSPPKKCELSQIPHPLVFPAPFCYVSVIALDYLHHNYQIQPATMKTKPPFSVSLVPTRIQIQKPESEKGKQSSPSFVKDGDFPKIGSFRRFMMIFFNEHLGKVNISNDDRSGFRVSKLLPKRTVSGRSKRNERIYGCVESGKFGFESELMNVKTKTTKRRESNDCELIPFFFAMDFEAHEESAILLTEQFGPYSPKGILLEHLRAFVESHMDGHKLITGTIVSEDIVRQVLSKQVKALRFHYKRVPPDIADKIDKTKNQHIERDGMMEIAIKAKRGSFPEWGFEFLHNVRRTGLTIFNEKSTELKVDMVVDGKTKTVNVGNMDSFNTSFVVDSIEDVQQNGHPTDARMREEAKDAFSICRKALGWPTYETDDENT